MQRITTNISLKKFDSKKRATTKKIKIGPANIDMLDESDHENEDDVEFLRINE
jgi:hypothetical protein